MIRPYGPGKYDTVVSAYLDDKYGDAIADEVGSVTEIGWWAGMVDLPEGDRPDPEDEEKYGPFTDEELRILRRMRGFIVTEDDQGFVHVDIFTSPSKLRSVWKRILAEAQEYEYGY